MAANLRDTPLAQIKDAKEALEKREEAMNQGKPIADKKQIRFADKDARVMVKKGNFDYLYNAPISVDEDTKIIVGQHRSQNANDKREVKPARYYPRNDGHAAGQTECQQRLLLR